MTQRRRCPTWLGTAGLCIALSLATGACADRTDPAGPSRDDPRVLLRDDFDGSALDLGTWVIPSGEGTFLGRTQLRPPTESVAVSDGVLRLRIDTFNPTARVAGDSFWGSEIVSRRTFARGRGLICQARVRVPDPVPGMVASFFAYRLARGTRNEIDLEILTNDAGTDRILTNYFLAQPFSSAGQPVHVAVPGFLPTDFADLEFAWLPDRIQWSVNGRTVREERVNVPGDRMTIRLNFWVPGADFRAAYDPRLQPASSVEGNRSFLYEVDFVEVRAR